MENLVDPLIKDKVTYTVTFNNNGGSPVANQKVPNGGKASRPDNPSWDGSGDFGFVNWYSDSYFTTPYGFDTPVTSDITLYAKWSSDIWDVNYMWNHSGLLEFATQKIGDGGTLTPPTPTRDGHSFGGWYKEDSCVNPWDFANDTVNSNTNLYAKWEAVGTETYTVTFESYGGTNVNSITGVGSGSTIAIPETPKLTNFIFGAWYKEPSLTNVWNFASDTVTDNITLHAEWIPRVYTYDTTGDGIIINSYTGSDTSVTIPAWIDGLPVTTIGVEAFENAATLSNVTIPINVTTIGANAFLFAPLTNITIGPNVGLGLDAFPGNFETFYDPDYDAVRTYTWVGISSSWTW